MNPARSFGSAVIVGKFAVHWVRPSAGSQGKGEGPSGNRDFHQQEDHRHLGRQVPLPQTILTPNGGFPKLRRPGPVSFLSSFKKSGVPSGLARNEPGQELQPWPRPQVLAVSLFTPSSWTNFQTWIKKKTNRNRHTHTHQQGQEQH